MVSYKGWLKRIHFPWEDEEDSLLAKGGVSGPIGIWVSGCVSKVGDFGYNFVS